MKTASNFSLQSAPRVFNGIVFRCMAVEKPRSAGISPQDSASSLFYETMHYPWWWRALSGNSSTICLQTTFRTQKLSSFRCRCAEQTKLLHIVPQPAQFEYDACRWYEYWLVFRVYCVHIGVTSAFECRFHRYTRAFLWECLWFFLNMPLLA